ncbi:hypothetical protein BASA50_007892 [Batrachochytrium salamandrivorans]|uniref:Multicopper oxidase n=1 Tax=Batrachochytrium salamandrivorans TaxID=1357716 RepID=A0ABQ8F8U7_9FUNG|nr:hypothetical protein BASA62_003002 [Batrachochytrium salamandrivorans]KAH6581675.1 hypothetical protein BASA60_002262 [Batrachochytrium salamandrivorans]KAH6592712.1 hypothetical protein BASA50_007892 [Batrachochytrium salamandrivorans]KAH6602352.1 hypothetical protein BASA61_001226 [Batrachochytrium salamandrivorans]KAH9245048.1 hypothetical protein BASA81_017504 [Batrachochytrium salamandrivorans]
MFPVFSLLATLVPIAVQAIVQDVTLNLAMYQAAPDGYQTTVYGANNMMEPPIIINKGDLLSLKVNNNLGLPTAIHCHGLFQKSTPYYDGAAGVTQCPIADQDSFRYDISVPDQHGTYWWHAHYKAQYVKGLRGPLIIKDPENEPYTADYDEEYIVMLTDWYHAKTSAEILDPFMVSLTGNEPIPDSGLINGKGRYNCSMATDKTVPCVSNAPLERFNFVAGKRYRLRIINGASMATFNFSIDGHTLQVIEADGVDTVKTPVDVIRISVAQRYSVIVEAKATPGNYWMRADIDTALYTVYQEGVLTPEIRAIISYTGSDADPTSTGPTPQAVMLNPFKLLPVSQIPLSHAVNQSLLFSFAIVPGPDNITRAYTNIDGHFTDSPYQMPMDTPTLFKAINGNAIESSANVIPVSVGQIIQMTVYNDDPMEHTFHLHGHTFQVVGTGIQLNFKKNPDAAKVLYPERDTIAIPACRIKANSTGGEGGMCGGTKGYVTIRFQAKNPGAWLFHCHIEWHMMQGLGITFLTGGTKELKTMKLPPRVIDGCARSGINIKANRFWAAPRIGL